MEGKMIAVRLEPEQVQKMESLAEMTGWSQSDIIRRLIDAAVVTPPAVWLEDVAKKGVPLADPVA